MVLGTLNDDPVAFISGNKLCLTFHPELDQIDIFHRILFDTRVHDPRGRMLGINIEYKF